MVNPITLKIRTKKLSALLKDARIAAGRSIKECAAILGLSSSKYGAYEKGDKAPSLPELEVLAFYLDTPLAHFWSQDSRSAGKQEMLETTNLYRKIPLRQRIVGAYLRKYRLEKAVTQKDLSESIGITPQRLKSYEEGSQPIPLPELEGLVTTLDVPLELFFAKDGTVGKWADEQRHIQQFLELSPEMQKFVTTPVNAPYLEIAMRMSGLSVDALRGLAEGLLDITL